MISRREFLKMCAIQPLVGLVNGLAGSPLGGEWLESTARPWPPELYRNLHNFKGRVATRSIYVYSAPDLKSKIVMRLHRDMLLSLWEEHGSFTGLERNPQWYRLEQGYVQSKHIQRLEGVHFNAPAESIPEDGQLGEITLPVVQSMRKLRRDEWDPLYRLYYQSVYWVTSLVEGPDGSAWYAIKDDLLNIVYCVPALAVRLVRPEELLPLSPDVPPEEKRLEVSLLNQTLTAYEGDQVVLHTRVSTGMPGGWLEAEEIDDDWIDPETPKGQFHIQVKTPSRHMGNGQITDNPDAYELPGVPWVSFFYKTGVAFHGTYWHNNFGHKMSHGCVNMRTDEDKWLYRWTMPAAGVQDKNVKGMGTLTKVT
jgi:hypothetical protein